MKNAKLDPRPVRRFTSRECAVVIGGTLGGLAESATSYELREAVQWWAENYDVACPHFFRATSEAPSSDRDSQLAEAHRLLTEFAQVDETTPPELFDTHADVAELAELCTHVERILDLQRRVLARVEKEKR